MRDRGASARCSTSPVRHRANHRPLREDNVLDERLARRREGDCRRGRRDGSAIGQGRAVLFAFRPQHRGQAHATFRLFFNAIHTSSASESPERERPALARERCSSRRGRGNFICGMVPWARAGNCDVAAGRSRILSPRSIATAYRVHLQTAWSRPQPGGIVTFRGERWWLARVDPYERRSVLTLDVDATWPTPTAACA